MLIHHSIEDIPHENRFIPMGNDDSVISRDGHDQHLEIGKEFPDLPQFPEFFPDHVTVLFDLNPNKLNPPVGKLRKIGGAGMFNEPHDGFCRLHFRVDAEVNIEMLFVENLGFPGVFEISDTRYTFRNLGLGPRYEAGDHVDLVAVRHGYHHFRLLDSRLLQDTRAAPFAEQ